MTLADGVHIPEGDKFAFDSEVVKIFDGPGGMAQRAIPSYTESHDWIRHLLPTPYPMFSQVWDFGCSTGTGLMTAMTALSDPRLEYVGCDISKPMVDEAAGKNRYGKFILHDLTHGLPRQLRRGEVAVGIFGWTLQFLEDRGTRVQLLVEAYDALLPGGKLFVFEKFQFSDVVMQQAADRGYYWWRRNNGYGFDEIHAKSLALANSMFPWEHEALENLLCSLPAARAHWLYRHYQFGGMVVEKLA